MPFYKHNSITRMRPMFRLITHCLLALTFTTFASAQEGKMSLKFIAFPASTDPEPVELIVGKKKVINVDTPGHEMSDTYRVPAMSEIIVGKTEIDDEGKAKFNIYGRAKALAAKEQIILLIRKGKDNSSGFVVLPVNGQNEDFAGGSFMFINASKIHCGGLIGDKKFTLKPGEQTLLKPKPDFDGDVCQVTLHYLRDTEEGQEWKKFRDTRWSGDKGMRTISFFYQHPKSGKIAIAPIVEIIGADRLEPRRDQAEPVN